VSLRQKIVDEIRAHGPMPFSRYMELCLYDPDLGYYARSASQFGKAGDFYTSSDVHAVFGRLLARQFEEMWRALGSPAQIAILELGPGRGLFAQDVLDWSEEKFPGFFGALHYSLAERSPTLQDRLRSTLSKHLDSRRASLVDGLSAAERRQNAAHGASRGLATQNDQAPEGRKSQNSALPGKGAISVIPPEPFFARALAPDVPLIIFANEFFDALPVEIVSTRGQLHISEKDGRFLESWLPASAETLDFLDRYSVHPEPGERLELPLIAQTYMTHAATLIDRGFLLAIDYGYTRSEQLAGRHRSTLMTSAGTNPYEAPGDQDITAHVNFTALAAAAEAQGMQAHPLLTQSQFLLGIGQQNEFADAFAKCRLPQERAKVALQLKHLVTPAGLGETFHVLLASKGVAPGAINNLSGLSFGKPARNLAGM
jgi:SAM-dependent MidA family methyltransferase